MLQLLRVINRACYFLSLEQAGERRQLHFQRKAEESWLFDALDDLKALCFEVLTGMTGLYRHNRTRQGTKFVPASLAA